MIPCGCFDGAAAGCCGESAGCAWVTEGMDTNRSVPSAAAAALRSVDIWSLVSTRYATRGAIRKAFTDHDLLRSPPARHPPEGRCRRPRIVGEAPTDRTRLRSNATHTERLLGLSLCTRALDSVRASARKDAEEHEESDHAVRTAAGRGNRRLRAGHALQLRQVGQLRRLQDLQV